MRDDITKFADKNGYEIQFENNSNFFITQDDTKYYNKCFLD